MKKLLSTLFLAFLSLFCFNYFSKMNISNSLTTSILGTVFGGLFLSFIYFLLYEFIYKVPDIEGTWKIEEKTLVSTYNPYINMKVIYTVLLWSEGTSIFGTGERAFEITADGNEMEYNSKQKINIEITGHLTKKYLWNDKAVLHYRENGSKRTSSTIHKLEIIGLDHFEGTFFKTAASSSGSSIWKRF